MRYMLMMHAPRGTGNYAVTAWAPGDLKAHIAFMHRLNEDLTAPGEARVVRTGKNGVPAVTDGPFAEAKEFLAGFWIVEVDRPERAYEIAARVSSAPGPKGTPLAMPVEVRQVMSAPPAEV